MKGWIQVAVADLRKEPQILVPQDFSHHSLRDSQLLFGEEVRIVEKWSEWLKIEALEQMRFSAEKGWHHYPGWVHKNEVCLSESAVIANAVICHSKVVISGLTFPLSFGTYVHQVEKGVILLPSGQKTTCDPACLRAFPQSFSRELLLQDAGLFMGSPYLWGGRASFLENIIASVDCSGLTNLLYRAQGISIPRDAHDQFLKSQLLSSSEVQQGDLIFLASEGKPERITHVMVYQGPSHCIEAPETGKRVRSVLFSSARSRHLEDPTVHLAFDRSIRGENVRVEERLNTYHAYYGSFL